MRWPSGPRTCMHPGHDEGPRPQVNPNLSISPGSTAANWRNALFRSRLKSKHPGPLWLINSIISSTPGSLNLYGSPKNSPFTMPSFTDCPGRQDKSMIILRSAESDLGTVFMGEMAKGVSKGLLWNGPKVAPNSTSFFTYLSTACGKSLQGTSVIFNSHPVMNIPLKADRELIFQPIKVPGLRVAQRQLTPSGYVQVCWYWYSTSLEIWETWLLYQPMHFQHSLGIMHGELSGHKTLSIWFKPTVTDNAGGHIHILVNTVGPIHIPSNTGLHSSRRYCREAHPHHHSRRGSHPHPCSHRGSHPATMGFTPAKLPTQALIGGVTPTSLLTPTYIVANTRGRAHLTTSEGGHAYITANAGGTLTLLLTPGFTVTLTILLTQGVMVISLPILGLTSTSLLPSHILFT